MENRVSRALIAAALGLAVALAGSAEAAMEVRDSTNLTQNARQVAETVKQLQELRAMVTTMQAQLRSIGSAGAVLGLEVPPWQRNLSSQLTGLTPRFDAWKLPRSTAVDISSVAKAVDFARKALDAPAPKTPGPDEPLSVASREELLARRGQALRDAAFEGLAVALHSQQTAGDASNQAQEIMAAGQGAQDMRAQLAVMIRAQSAVLQEMVAQRALHAAALRLQASQQLAILPIGVGYGASEIGAAADQDDSNPFAGTR